MISTEMLIYASVAVVSVIVGAGVVRYIHWRIQPPPGFEETGEDPDELGFDLADPLVRHRLKRAIDKNHIVGSADIRDGKVYAPVPFERMHPLLSVIDNANAALHRLKNPAACSLYVRDSMNDKFMLVPDLDLEDLREIAELLRAAVAERMRSKGIGN